MQLLPKFSEDKFGGEDLWFVVEKSGLDDTELTGYIDPVIHNEINVGQGSNSSG